MKKKNSIHIPQWVIYTVVSLSGVAFMVGVLLPENYISVVSNRISVISGAASILLALLAIVLTLRLQETDETIAVMKHNINEQKQVYLNMYIRINTELSTESWALYNLLQNEYDIVFIQHIIEPVNRMFNTINKLWQLPVINMTEEYEDAFSEFNSKIFVTQL